MSEPQHSPAAPIDTVETLLRIADVIDMTKLSSATIYRKIGAGTFPRPRNLGGNIVRWRMSDVQRWISDLPTQE